MNKSLSPSVGNVAKALDQAALLNRVLRISLRDLPLKDVLEQALAELLQLSWLALEPKGGVFLLDNEGGDLELIAGHALDPEIFDLCAKVPLGHCLCGRAAQEGQVQHAECVDCRHVTKFQGMQPHGHYNVPIMAEKRVLGVLVVYLPHGHARDEGEVAFLKSFADILALLISDKRRAQVVRETKDRLQATLNETNALMATIQMHTIFSQVSVGGKILDVNDNFCSISGYSREELIGAPHSIINSGRHSRGFWHRFWRKIASGQAWRGEICNRSRDGRLYWVDSIVMPLKDERGRVARYISVRFDVTERKQAEEQLVRMGRILDRSSNEIYVFDAENLKFSQANRGARENLGYSAEEIRRLRAHDIKPTHTADSFEALVEPLVNMQKDSLSYETVHERKDKTRYPVSVNLEYAGDETPPSFVAIVQDISERKANDERIERLAFYDPLTGLANRALMADRLRQAVCRAQRVGCNARLLYMDLNRFKEINDTRGHAVGDLVLQEVAQRFNSVIRTSETLARIGGDEFVAILENADMDQTTHVIRRLKEQLARPLNIEGKLHSLGVSVGVATYPDSSRSPEELLRQADIAMYEAKANGGGFRFYDREMGQRLARRLELSDRLADAIAQDRLQLHYQPVLDLQSGALAGAEALLRWNEPGWGWIGPSEFIPIAEERRMMFDLGDWVIDRACAQYAAWRDQGLRIPERIAINVAAQQMEADHLMQSICGALDRHGVDASALEVEITESSMMNDPDGAAVILNQLKALGVHLAIDDFGTGYSSLAYLKQFNTDKLKIDMSFIRELMEDPNCQAIVAATVGMARGLGLSVLAEGIESADQADHLRRLRCDLGQGHLFGRALPPDEFARTWLGQVDAQTGT